jgi:hypothetical protein
MEAGGGKATVAEVYFHASYIVRQVVNSSMSGDHLKGVVFD